MTTSETRAAILEGLAQRTEDLKGAMAELYGDAEPRDPAVLVKRIRAARSEIRSLLEDAARLKMQDPLVLRLRAAHLSWPPK